MLLAYDEVLYQFLFLRPTGAPVDAYLVDLPRLLVQSLLILVIANAMCIARPPRSLPRGRGRRYTVQAVGARIISVLVSRAPYSALF